MKNLKQPLMTYGPLLAASLLLMFLFAYNTSPFSQYIGVDSGMYLVMGKAMAHGKILYADLFDHKGPLIFILNMLPQLLIKGTTGVWLMELLFMCCACVLLYQIASHHLSRRAALCIPLIYLWVSVSLFNGGNYTEEYSNFFCVICLFIFDKWQKEQKLTVLMSFLLGLCFAFVFFLRPNNTALIGAVILFMGISMLKNSRGQIKSALLFGLLGISSVTLPIILYHLGTGTFYDLWEATVLHNIKYCQVGTEHFRLLPNGNGHQHLCFWIAYLMNIMALCTCYSCNDNTQGHFILLSTMVLSFAILISRHSFLYYWTLLAPLTAYSALFIMKHSLKKKKKKKKSIKVLPFLLLLSLFLINSFLGTELPEKRSTITDYKRNAHEMYAHIPENEKNDCFGYNMPCPFIYEVDLMTPCKYFTMQTWMAKVNPDISRYCNSYIKESKPKWLLSYYELEKSNMTDPELLQIISSDYTQVFSNDCGYLYQRKETTYERN